MRYLPKLATIEQACGYLTNATGSEWVLPRLIESGLTPYFWLDYTEESAALFGGIREGYLTRMVFEGDLTRLESMPDVALAQMFTARDGALVRCNPPMPLPLSELRFRREDVEEIAAIFTSAPATVKGTDKRWTDEFKAEVRAYRERHGLKKTAEHYKVSQTVISRHVPAKKRPAGHWDGLVKK